MKFTLLSVFAIFFASSVANSATFIAGSNVEFLAVNGTKVEENATKKLELKEGRYQLVAFYEKNLKRGSKNSLFTSLPYVFDIEVGQQDLELTIPRMRTESQARAFFRKPKWQLIETSTDSTQIIFGEKLMGKGFAPFSDIERAIAYHNAEKNILLSSFSPPPPSSSPSVKNTDDSNLVLLKSLYSQASAEEKKAFKYWMLDNDF